MKYIFRIIITVVIISNSFFMTFWSGHNDYIVDTINIITNRYWKIKNGNLIKAFEAMVESYWEYAVVLFDRKIHKRFNQKWFSEDEQRNISYQLLSQLYNNREWLELWKSYESNNEEVTLLYWWWSGACYRWSIRLGNQKIFESKKIEWYESWCSINYFYDEWHIFDICVWDGWWSWECTFARSIYIGWKFTVQWFWYRNSYWENIIYPSWLQKIDPYYLDAATIEREMIINVIESL